MREGTGGLGELLHYCDPSHGFSPYEHTWPFPTCAALLITVIPIMRIIGSGRSCDLHKVTWS